MSQDQLASTRTEGVSPACSSINQAVAIVLGFMLRLPTAASTDKLTAKLPVCSQPALQDDVLRAPDFDLLRGSPEKVSRGL